MFPYEVLVLICHIGIFVLAYNCKQKVSRKIFMRFCFGQVFKFCINIRDNKPKFLVYIQYK